MNVEVKQLKDTLTGEVFVPLTHWDAVANKPEDIAKEPTLLAESQAIQDKIDNIKLPEVDTSALAKESTLYEVSSKLDNLNVDVDLSGVAKQGDNAEATNSAIYKLLIGSNEPSLDIPEGVAERLALILEFFGITSSTAFEAVTEQEIIDELNNLWDISLK